VISVYKIAQEGERAKTISTFNISRWLDCNYCSGAGNVGG